MTGYSSTNTHILSPPWAAVSPVLIPFEPCNGAADLLVDWFSDPNELHGIVGGERWWQVRGLDGVEGEWVTQRSFIKDDDSTERIKKWEEEKGRPLSDYEADIVKMDSLEPVIVGSFVSTARLTLTLDAIQLYVHGGRYNLLHVRSPCSNYEDRCLLLGINQFVNLSCCQIHIDSVLAKTHTGIKF